MGISELHKLREEQNKKIRYEVLTVTPAIATKWLEGNVLNRDITQSHVEFLARLMRDGQWHLNNNAIAFDDNERHPCLLDGQHRLWAVITSGVTVQMLIGYGFAQELQKYIDTGKRRTAKDAAKISGIKGVTVRHISTAKTMMLYGSGYNIRLVSNEDVVEYLKRTLEAIDFVHREVVKSSQTRGFAQSGLTAVLAQAYFTQNHDALTEFGDVLISGEIHRTPGSTAPLLMRDYLLRPGIGQRLTQVSIYRRTQTALESFIRNNTLKELTESTHQFFPLPADLVVSIRPVNEETK